MVARLSSVLACSAVAAYACGCKAPSVKAAKEHSGVVFRGTIVELRDAPGPFTSSPPLFRDTGKTAVIRVNRVWKGEVGETFEMPAIEETSVCIGFWPDFLKVGADLLVYAGRFFGTSTYVTSVCTRTSFAKNAKDDFDQLGPGEEPRKSKAEKHTLEEVRFMSGHWLGSDGSSEIEEQWSEPSNGTMIGMYREMSAGKTTFYEFLAIAQEETGVVMRMKHFDANLVGWEEKDRSVVFDVASTSKDEAIIVSRDQTKPIRLAYRRTSQTELTATLIRERDGKTLHDEFHYRLVP
jgi:hypothetical protein